MSPRALLLAAVSALLTATGGCAEPATTVHLPDGRSLALHCSGAGTPTVVLESGWGADARAWWRVQPLVAATNRVCSYDRAGMGASDPGRDPRDGAAIARDLDDALRAAGIGGPLVVVGHSAGGLYARLFALRRPREVVGLVLVEPSVEHQDRRLGPGGSVASLLARTRKCGAAAAARTLPSPDPGLAKCDAALSPATYAAEASELEALMGATSDEIDVGPPSDGALPLIVLSAASGSAAWIELHAEVARRSTRGEHRLVVGSGHLMPKDRPDAVAQAIRDVIAMGR